LIIFLFLLDESQLGFLQKKWPIPKNFFRRLVRGLADGSAAGFDGFTIGREKRQKVSNQSGKFLTTGQESGGQQPTIFSWKGEYR
jgi:hypothetical protein